MSDYSTLEHWTYIPGHVMCDEHNEFRADGWNIEEKSFSGATQ